MPPSILFALFVIWVVLLVVELSSFLSSLPYSLPLGFTAAISSQLLLIEEKSDLHVLDLHDFNQFLDRLVNEIQLSLFHIC